MGILIFLLALGICILVFACYSYRITFFSPKKRTEDLYHVPEGEQYEKYGQRMVEISLIMDDAACQWVRTTAHDGTTLHGRLYEFYPDAPIFLAFHGYRSMASRYFSGRHKLARQMGHNILLVDQRAHGHSEGRVITFGIRERYDCLDWCRWAAQRQPNSRILLCGVSMGAATVLMASDLPLPDAVCGIMADSPYTSPAAIIRKVCEQDMHIPAWLGMPFVRLGAVLFGHFRLGSASAVESVQRTTLPVLIMHGESDTFVPCDMGKEIAAACAAPVTIATFPDADHAQGYLVHPQPYEEAFCCFVEEVLKDE